MTLKRTICPKCGYEQTETDEFLKCGVIISEFMDLYKRTESDQRSGLRKTVTSGVKNPLVKWAIRAAILFFLTVFAIVYYFKWWIEHTHRLNYPSWDYCYSATETLLDRYNDTCCAESLRTFLKFDQHNRSKIDQILQGLIPPEEIRHLGFLIAKNLKIPKVNEIPIIICKTPIETVRKKKDTPPKNHLAGLANRGCKWLAPYEYMSLDKSLLFDIETLIKELQYIRRNKNS